MNVADADELEGRLVAVNPQPMLRQSPSAPGAGTKTSGKQSERLAKRSKIEKERRDWERRQLERMTRLFKVPSKLKVWSRKDVLSLGEMISRVLEMIDHLQNSIQRFSSSSTDPQRSL